MDLMKKIWWKSVLRKMIKKRVSYKRISFLNRKSEPSSLSKDIFSINLKSSINCFKFLSVRSFVCNTVLRNKFPIGKSIDVKVKQKLSEPKLKNPLSLSLSTETHFIWQNSFSVLTIISSFLQKKADLEPQTMQLCSSNFNLAQLISM